jgi:hypothetical protein
MRKFHGHISWVRALGFMLFEEDPPNLYKIETALESDKWSLNSWHWNMVYFLKIFTIYTDKEQIAGPKMTMPCGNLTDIFLGLGLWALCCLQKTLQICTKSNPHWNQTNGL